MLRSRIQATLSVLLLAACGGTADDAAPATAEPAETPATQAEPAPPAAQPVDETAELQGITFHVTSPNSASGNSVLVMPAGLETDNSMLEKSVDGIVTGVRVEDLDANGSPEVYVFMNGSEGTPGSIAAWAANNRKSMSEIYLPPLPDDALAGYRGGDEFEVVESTLVRRFPIYESSEAGAAATGQTRQLQYKLEPGEAGWVLRLDRTTEF